MRSIWTEACVVDNIRGSSNCTEYLLPRWAMARRTAKLLAGKPQGLRS
eukprot:CAMPEP_0181208072 /NCGR_PEP_ID=MMETSP1096-20121128/21928_1 /TAXON_ID=156174 ORGANISM="Chrysochromulina ericina, Strain CCMP281" /NCGR_SAMPLE_ID=MMETSP1096 /ASSEMBLY_ACC=CAM_ASM_000453 /LENGTH=47 /DNA_ID= /DNA_START= /DNA_END= /DNA_ORIENTATION=